MWEFAKNTKPKARKDHVCDHCRCKISAGEIYDRCDGMWEGEFGSFKSHADCQKLAFDLHRLGDLCSDEGVILHEELQEMEDPTWIILDYPEVAERLGIRKAAS